jgi:hypothetical protein
MRWRRWASERAKFTSFVAVLLSLDLDLPQWRRIGMAMVAICDVESIGR